MFSPSEINRHIAAASRVYAAAQNQYLAGNLATEPVLPEELRFAGDWFNLDELAERRGVQIVEGELNDNYVFNLAFLNYLNENQRCTCFMCDWFGVEGFSVDYINHFASRRLLAAEYTHAINLIEQCREILNAGWATHLIIDSLDWIFDMDPKLNFQKFFDQLECTVSRANAALFICTTASTLTHCKISNQNIIKVYQF